MSAPPRRSRPHFEHVQAALQRHAPGPIDTVASCRSTEFSRAKRIEMAQCIAMLHNSLHLLPLIGFSGPFQGHFRAISGPFQGHSRAISRPFQGHFRAIPGPFERENPPTPADARGSASGQRGCEQQHQHQHQQQLSFG